jgi:hypothetical protein
MNSSAKLFVVLAITRFNCNRILIEKRQSLHIFLNGPKGSAFAEFALSERTAELRNYNRALPCKNKPARHQPTSKRKTELRNFMRAPSIRSARHFSSHSAKHFLRFCW